MMWQWLVTGLHSGCSLLLYDGSPLAPHPAILWDIVDKYGLFEKNVAMMSAWVSFMVL